MSTDKLIDSDLTRADLVCLLRKAQAERDEYQRRELDAESALTLARLELESLKREALPAMIVHVNVRTAWESGSPKACAAEILRLNKQGERAGVKAPEPVDLAAHWRDVLAETPMSTLAASMAAVREATAKQTVAVARVREAQAVLLRTIEIYGSTSEQVAEIEANLAKYRARLEKLNGG